MGWRCGSRGRRQGSWKEHSGSQFSLTVLAPAPRVVLGIPGLELFYTGEECVKRGSRIREVNRMSAYQTQDKHRLWEIGKKKKKKIRGNLCKTPGVRNSEVCPHLQVVSKIGEKSPKYPRDW